MQMLLGHIQMRLWMYGLQRCSGKLRIIGQILGLPSSRIHWFDVGNVRYEGFALAIHQGYCGGGCT
jgi:hypothetical protein